MDGDGVPVGLSSDTAAEAYARQHSIGAHVCRLTCEVRDLRREVEALRVEVAQLKGTRPC